MASGFPKGVFQSKRSKGKTPMRKFSFTCSTCWYN